MTLVHSVRSGIARHLLGLLLVTVTALSATAALASGPSENLTDFDFVTAKVQANYSGWETKTAGSRGAELDALTRRLREQVARGGDDAFRQSMEAWVAWFNDGHLQLQWAASGQTPPWREMSRPLSEQTAREQLAAVRSQRAPVEGLWTIDDRYRLAVLRRDRQARLFDAVVLSTTADGWKPGDVKAVLASRPDGAYDIRYGAGDRTELRLQGRLRGRGDVLEVDDFGIWRRVHDDPAQALAALRRWPSDDFMLARIHADTLYLRLPSFGDQHTGTVRALLATHADELARTPNLIIDVRFNGGGSDFVYAPA